MENSDKIMDAGPRSERQLTSSMNKGKGAAENQQPSRPRDSDRDSQARDGVAVGGILEVFVFQARSLPTQEWTQAFCTLEMEKNSFSAKKNGLGSTNILKNVQTMTLNDRWAFNPNEDEVPESEAESGGNSVDTVAGRGHVHRTHIVGGTGQPNWDRGFQFGISRPFSSDQLRVQVLHKAAVGTEFIGAVTVEVRTIIEKLTSLNTKTSAEDTQRPAETILSESASQLSRSKAGKGDGSALGGKWELVRVPETENPRKSDMKTMRTRKDEPEPPQVWACFMPLRNVVGERARVPSGGGSELRLGFRWTYPAQAKIVRIQGLLQEPVLPSVNGEDQESTIDGKLEWTSGRYVLDGPEQILWMRQRAGIGRKTNIRFAQVRDESDNIAPFSFSVTSTSGSKFVGKALDEEDHHRWLFALKAATGFEEEEHEPEAEITFFMRYRWSMVLSASLLLVLLMLTVLLLTLRSSAHPKPLHAASWGQCTDSHTKAVFCMGCDCFLRCVYGNSGGLQLKNPVLVFHNCSAACNCVLPPPKMGCGDGVLRRQSVVEWYGKKVSVHEECDDGNTMKGDGCDDLCRIEHFMMTDTPAVRSRSNTTSLCGNSHTFSDCEQA